MRALLLGFAIAAAACSGQLGGNFGTSGQGPSGTPVGGNAADGAATNFPSGPGAPPSTMTPGGGFVDGGYHLDAGSASGPSAGGGAADAAGGFLPPGAGGMGGATSDAAAPTPPPAPVTPPPSSVPPPGCTVQLRPLTATTLDTLVAGPEASAVVRAEVGGVTPGGRLPWSWQVSYGPGNQPVTITADPADGAVIQFPLRDPGAYLITASTTMGNSSCSSGSVYAAAADRKQLDLFVVRAFPSAAAQMPIQDQVLKAPQGGSLMADMHLRPGTMVTIDPRGQTGADSVPAYVRISDRTGPLTFEGYTSAAAFGALLQADRPYDVLIVPTGPDRTGVGALYAPLLIGNQTPDQIRILPLRLAPGIDVRGALAAAGGAIADGRVVLRVGDLVSTVARTGSDGGFEVLSRAGAFSLVASPPPGSGLPELQAGPAPELTLTDGVPAPSLALRWNTLPTVDGLVTVLGPDGRPMANARVHLEARLPAAGALAVGMPGGFVTLPAVGTMRVEAVTGADGVAHLGRLASGEYAGVVAPPAAGAAITGARLVIDSGAARTIRVQAPVSLRGALLGTGDLSSIRLTATDVGADVTAPPLAALSAADGSFVLAVSPGRRYVIVADPPPGSPFARGFVGDGQVEASSFVLRQPVPRRLAFRGRVLADGQTAGFSDTLLKVFCLAGSPGCADATAPLAETVTGSDGSFELGLPDPATR